MPISKGEPWGEPGAAARATAWSCAPTPRRATIVTAARRAGEPIPPLGLLGGDLCRTLGGTGDEARLRSDAAVQLPVDLGAVLVDGRLHWFVAHLVARRGWWRGRVVAAMNARVPRRRGTWRRAATPTTVASTSSTPTCPSTSASRCAPGSSTAPTCPTRASTSATRAAVQLDLDRPTPVYLDGRAPRPRQDPVASGSNPTPSSASSDRVGPCPSVAGVATELDTGCGGGRSPSRG